MDDELTTLEQTMRERAAEIPYEQEAPRVMLVRARRRIARNALASVMAVALVVGGASAGLAHLGVIGASPTPAHPGPSRPSPTGFAASSCAAGDLRATATLQGAAGSVVGSLNLTNFSAKTCTLTGRPVITLTSSAGRALTVQVVDTVPQWRADSAPKPNGWPIVNLRPGAAASVRISWSNECPQLMKPALWKVGFASGGQIDVFGADGTSPPPCNGATLPSTLEVGPFEPSPVP